MVLVDFVSRFNKEETVRIVNKKDELLYEGAAGKLDELLSANVATSTTKIVDGEKIQIVTSLV